MWALPEFNQHLAMAIGDEFVPEAVNAMAVAGDGRGMRAAQTPAAADLSTKMASDILHQLDAAIVPG